MKKFLLTLTCVLITFTIISANDSKKIIKAVKASNLNNFQCLTAYFIPWCRETTATVTACSDSNISIWFLIAACVNAGDAATADLCGDSGETLC